MIIIVNGALGVGKSSLAEALSERIEASVYLDGDHIMSVNPEPTKPHKLFHATIALMISHFRTFGYRHFVISHFWDSPATLAELTNEIRRIYPGLSIRCFLASLPLDENIERIQRRQSTRAIYELDFEMKTMWQERRALSRWSNGEVGEKLDVSGSIQTVVPKVLALLGAEFSDTDNPN